MIVANMATYPARRDLLERLLPAIAEQVDILHLCLNDYSSVPEFVSRLRNVRPTLPETDLKDVGKFIVRPLDEDVVLYVDDDLVYPSDYVDVMCRMLDGLESRDVVAGLHGIIYLDIAIDKARARCVYVFDQAVESPVVCNQLGTGTIVCHGRNAPSLAAMLGSQRWVDIRFANICHGKDLPLVCLPRKAGWLTDAEGERETIFQSFTRNPTDDCLAEISRFAGFAHLNPGAVARFEGKRRLAE